ncbi:MAG: hypothetical protein ACTJHM_10710, partial [Agrococcus casei]|uniref:hypothetical protein n=1 Tax=Agrococcus casei TaxID=343512 RepID=UPI003F8F8C4B
TREPILAGLAVHGPLTSYGDAAESSIATPAAQRRDPSEIVGGERIFLCPEHCLRDAVMVHV